MNREQAAALLGVTPNADAESVQAAFRERARQAHPDTASDVGADLGELARARDLLIEADAPAPPSNGMPDQQTRPSRSQPGQQEPAGRIAGFSAKAVFACLAAALFVVFMIVAASVLKGESDPTPGLDSAECVVVSDQSVQPALCSQAGAQKIMSQRVGSHSCAPRQNTLIADSVTWCLQPAS